MVLPRHHWFPPWNPRSPAPPPCGASSCLPSFFWTQCESSFVLTIRARVDAHREASDGGKTVPGLFFFELEPSPHGKAPDGRRGPGLPGVASSYDPKVLDGYFPTGILHDAATRRTRRCKRAGQPTGWQLRAVVSWILTPPRRPRFSKRDARPSRCVTSYRADTPIVRSCLCGRRTVKGVKTSLRAAN